MAVDRYNHLDEYPENYAALKKKKKQSWEDTYLCNTLAWQNFRNGEQMSGRQQWERGRGDSKNNMEDTPGDGTLQCLDCGGRYTSLHKC